MDTYGSGAVFAQFGGVAPPFYQLTSTGTVTAPASITLPTHLNILNSTRLDVGASDITINGNLTWTSGGYVTMQNAGGLLTVNGDVNAYGVDLGDGALTNGTLSLKGNLNTVSGNGQAFRATGSHLTRFSGTGAQSMYFYYTGANQMQFANLEIANSSVAGVSPTSNIPVAGTLNQLGKLTITSVAMSVNGALSLGASSITNVVGGLSFASCSKTGTPTFTGFICP
jgi:hypothetical protein